jgi:tetratricopeptide (TPR) repeat protein
MDLPRNRRGFHVFPKHVLLRRRNEKVGAAPQLSYDAFLMTMLKIFLGLLLLGLAWIYIFRKNMVFQLNQWMRETVFNDQVALFSGKRVAVLLFALGLIALFSGIKNVVTVQGIPPNVAADMISQSREHLAKKEYAQVVARCKELVRANPSSVEAWELLAAAWSALQQKALAIQAAENLFRLDPENALAHEILRHKNEARIKQKGEPR